LRAKKPILDPNYGNRAGYRANFLSGQFLTVAFGGAAIGPIILAGLKNLQERMRTRRGSLYLIVRRAASTHRKCTLPYESM
jgi:hypothetical protein